MECILLDFFNRISLRLGTTLDDIILKNIRKSYSTNFIQLYIVFKLVDESCGVMNGFFYH